MFELIAIHTERFASQHLVMRTVDRVHGNVASNVRSPTFEKIRTPITLIPHSGKYDYITIENTGFVGSQQWYCAVKVLNNRIEKLTISRTFYGPSFAEQLAYLLIGKRLIPLWTMQTIKPHDFFLHLLLE